MLTYLLASKRSITAIAIAAIVVDIVVGTMLLASESNGLRFGFYKVKETKRG